MLWRVFRRVDCSKRWRARILKVTVTLEGVAELVPRSSASEEASPFMCTWSLLSWQRYSLECMAVHRRTYSTRQHYIWWEGWFRRMDDTSSWPSSASLQGLPRQVYTALISLHQAIASLVVSNGQRQFVQKEGLGYTVRYGPALQSIVSELIIRLFFTHVPGLRLGLVGWRHGDMWRAAFAWFFFPIGPSLQNVTSIRFSVWCFQSAYKLSTERDLVRVLALERHVSYQLGKPWGFFLSSLIEYCSLVATRGCTQFIAKKSAWVFEIDGESGVCGNNDILSVVVIERMARSMRRAVCVFIALLYSFMFCELIMRRMWLRCRDS